MDLAQRAAKFHQRPNLVPIFRGDDDFSWPKLAEMEYLIERNKTSNKTVLLNVGGTRFEVNN